MLSKSEKLRVGKNGFTLVELLAVMVILGILLGIGVPKYIKLQAQSEYDADVAMIKSLAKAAEMYVVKTDNYNNKTISNLVTNKAIKDVILNRKNSAGASVKNTGLRITQVKDTATFVFDPDTGYVTDASLRQVITDLIGSTVY